MTDILLNRREALQTGALSTAGLLALLADPRFVFAAQAAEETLVPFLDMPRARPGSLDWETLTEWLTPQDLFKGGAARVPNLLAFVKQLQRATNYRTQHCFR